MIRAVFHRARNGFLQAEISGHAGFAGYGEDIVCASVTSAVQMAANGITEVLRAPARVEVGENRITIALEQNSGQEAARFLEALHLHLELLSQQYENTIHLTDREV